MCGDCSSNSLPLPAEQLYHPVRICDACFRNNSVTNQQQPDDDETIETSENVFRDVSETDDDDAKPSDVNVVVNVVEDELTIGPSSDLKAAQCFDKNSEWALFCIRRKKVLKYNIFKKNLFTVIFLKKNVEHHCYPLSPNQIMFIEKNCLFCPDNFNDFLG